MDIDSEVFNISTPYTTEVDALPLTRILLASTLKLIATSVTFHVPNGPSENFAPISNALITEESKTRQKLVKHARNGVRITLMIIQERRSIIQLRVSTPISAEIRMVRKQFGATQQIPIQERKNVILYLSKVTKLLFSHHTTQMEYSQSIIPHLQE